MISYHNAPVPGLAHAEIGRFEIRDLGPVVGYDAAQDPAAGRILLRALVAGRPFRDHDHQDETEMDFHLAVPDVLHEDLEPTVFRGQQSNTSVMFGDVAMIKIFRRLELGHNLDIEVHDALRRAGVHDVADAVRLGRGRLDPRRRAGTRRPGHGGRETGSGRGRLGSGARGPAGRGSSFAAEAHRLGVALAEIHPALRTAFPTATQPGRRWRRS